MDLILKHYPLINMDSSSVNIIPNINMDSPFINNIANINVDYDINSISYRRTSTHIP